MNEIVNYNKLFCAYSNRNTIDQSTELIGLVDLCFATCFTLSMHLWPAKVGNSPPTGMLGPARQGYYVLRIALSRSCRMFDVYCL